MAAPRQVIGSLQAGRGLAALAVLLHHTGTYVDQQIGRLPGLVAAPFALGDLGVDFFFVLSGFIIFYGNRAGPHDRAWARRFVERRLIRVYPPYLIVGIGLALLYTLLPALSRASRGWSWLATLTLLPVGREPALAVAWTLQHEVLFYALALALLWTRRERIGLALWSVVILVLLPFGFLRQPMVSPIDLEFVFGAVCAWAVVRDRGPRRWLAPLGLILIFVFLATGLAAPAPSGQRPASAIFGLGLALLLGPIVRAELAGRFRVAPAWLLLGEASYAIYLVHQPVLSIVVRLIPARHPLLGASVCIAAGLLAGLLFHFLIERPLLRRLRHRWHAGPRNVGVSA